MERLIWVTWRAFWVGLGASLVLIVQAVAPLTSAPLVSAPQSEVRAATGVSWASDPAPRPAPRSEERARTKSADPILTRNPFDSKTGPLLALPPGRPRGA